MIYSTKEGADIHLMYNVLVKKRRKCNVELVKRARPTSLELSAGVHFKSGSDILHSNRLNFPVSCSQIRRFTFAAHRNSVITVSYCGLSLVFLFVQTLLAQLITPQGSTLVISLFGRLALNS